MNDLETRATKMLPTSEPFRLVGVTRSIHFLRGVFSRASMCIPAFYYFLGSASANEEVKKSDDFSLRIAQAYSEFSDLNTLTLACRKMFDHATKPDLTGANFSKTSEEVLLEHAKYWAKYSGKDTNQCLSALIFLRKFFAEYSKSTSSLLKSDGCLSKRIGLLKQHADRAAAHLSLEDYSLEIADLAHFAASVAIVGEIVRCFDNSAVGEKYFNELDQGAYAAAKKVFPKIIEFRLFDSMQVHQQARSYWKNQDNENIRECFDQLQWAIG